ncbi:NAC domain-containing protein 55-like [Cornus florida]|uniref:NAC domain-containing protein 55-like n=1 Tax=Cornus florida TaxID=4283 RepID=UPI00289B301A|nr:NAC domain-containing protein 55-like [Cornus florida]
MNATLSFMGDPKNRKMASFSRPHCCRFYPSEAQLLCYHLSSKNADDRRFGCDLIREIDLYGHDPFDLPESSCFRFGRGGRKRYWYCYAARVLKERGRRRAGGGYWKSRGRVRDVYSGAGKVVVGTRRTFVFYLGNSPKTAKRTHLVMYEYTPIDHNQASFVLCRIFVKSHGVNNILDHVLSSCGEESVATVRHIGIQYDGTVHDDNSVERKNEVLRFPMGLVDELDDRVPAETVAVASFQLPSSTQPNEPVMSSGLSGNGTVH